MRHGGRHTHRDFPRTARINELLRQILADALERIDDDRTQLATVTGVQCDPDLKRALVFFDGPDGAAGDEELGAALADLRPRLQGAVARQARLKHTPELSFAPDPAIRTGEHIDEVLRSIDLGSTAASHEPRDDAHDGDGGEEPPADRDA